MHPFSAALGLVESRLSSARSVSFTFVYHAFGISLYTRLSPSAVTSLFRLRDGRRRFTHRQAYQPLREQWCVTNVRRCGATANKYGHRHRCQSRRIDQDAGRVRGGCRGEYSCHFLPILHQRCQIHDPDGLITILKACLRTSNQHLTAATLSALPPLIPLLISRHNINPYGRMLSSPSLSSSTSSSSSFVDAVTLRQVLTAFLPAGGLIERLGDKEKIQAKARETLVILGGFAYRSGATSAMSTGSRSGKGPETPLAIFERFMRESGLGSKVWKVREQVCRLVSDITRS